jgi:hypothetical protein
MNGWHVKVYRASVCWIALGRRTPFPPKCKLMGPDGRFALGETAEEALARLREAIGA